MQLFLRNHFVSEIGTHLYPQNKVASFLMGKESLRNGIVHTSARMFLF